jgi:hypothetical protein
LVIEIYLEFVLLEFGIYPLRRLDEAEPRPHLFLQALPVEAS